LKPCMLRPDFTCRLAPCSTPPWNGGIQKARCPAVKLGIVDGMSSGPHPHAIPAPPGRLLLGGTSSAHAHGGKYPADHQFP
jgi:hypothetical protein